MKTISFVILFVAITGFAKPDTEPIKINWSRAFALNIGGKTLRQICENKTYCTKMAEESLVDSAKFKLISTDSSTLLISYKNQISTVQHLSNTTVYKVNQKTLDLASVKDPEDLLQ